MNAMQSMATDFHPSTLADIYQPDINIAIWQRSLSASITRYASHLMARFGAPLAKRNTKY